MQTNEQRIIRAVATACALPEKSVEATVRLLDDGATVPFISRYRKELTGSLDEVQIRAIESRIKSERELEARREFVRAAIEEAGEMTAQLAERLDAADSMTAVEDIYAPFKPRKRTRATMAREKGLEPLSRIIMSGNIADCHRAAQRFCGKNGVTDCDEALAGASDIIAEWASESTRLRNITRNCYRRSSQISANVAKGKEADIAASPYAQYAGFATATRRISGPAACRGRRSA